MPVRARDAFAQALHANGETELALDHAREAVRLEAFRESGYLRLMKLLVDHGTRAEAIRVFERCRRLLEADLESGPPRTWKRSTASFSGPRPRPPLTQPRAPSDEPLAADGCNLVIMDEKEFGSIRGWFAGRLPDGWFTGTEVSIEDDQIVVIGTLPEVRVEGDEAPEVSEGAAAGRIARFREETRGQRIAIAREAEERFHRHVTWGAKLGPVTKRFTPGGSGWRGPRGHWGHWGRWGRGRGWSRGQQGAASEPQVF